MSPRLTVTCYLAVFAAFHYFVSCSPHGHRQYRPFPLIAKTEQQYPNTGSSYHSSSYVRPSQHIYPYPSRPSRTFGDPDTIETPADDRRSVIYSYAPPDPSFPYSSSETNVPEASAKQISLGESYNKKYPLTSPVIKYRIGVVSDLDKAAVETATEAAGGDPKTTGNWFSYLREGYLFFEQNPDDPDNPNITIQWKDDRVHTIRSGLSYESRGMELSTLNVFNGRLYSCDDKTGVVYELRRSDSMKIEPIPWTILADGNFTGPQGFKCEWATVKDNELWVGGRGQNTVDKKTGSITGMNEKFIKVISPSGAVRHLDWRKNFDKMAEALGVHFPGYVVHEAAGWSEIDQKWLFMPRQVSKEMYRHSDHETQGSNTLLLADENFENVQVSHVGDLIPDQGFSSFKFVPGTGDRVVLAIKSVETDQKTESYIMAFNLNGHVLLPQTKFADQKYEGVEFI